MNTAALAGGHTQLCLRIDDFQTRRTFHPRPTQKWAQIDLFSSCKPTEYPKMNDFQTPQKNKVTFLD